MDFEQFNIQTSESIKLIFDLTRRIDEKIGKLIEKQENFSARLSILENNDEKLDKFISLSQELINRVSLIESKGIMSVSDISDLEKDMHEFKERLRTFELKIESIGVKTLQQETRWSQVLDLIFKLTLMLIGGFLLYKLGLQSPPN